ncbi:hypothetical protein [Paraburkholderia adhaesiva]|uniref:hypothetical protein n=1 Tax=Paraburkholderia adhaesiva TaxID=2883244 RepID=UPI001F246296|nr:hypothetical protein [Paraburkholderia adhaesiva]
MEMKKSSFRAARGDLIITQTTSSYVHLKEGSQSRTFLTLGRVTSVSRDGRVKAYRTFGAHHDSRSTPSHCHLVTAQTVDLAAIERDMTELIASRWNANEFVDLDSVRAYLRPFKATAANGKSQPGKVDI